jgi:hypothetical protein
LCSFGHNSPLDIFILVLYLFSLTLTVGSLLLPHEIDPTLARNRDLLAGIVAMLVAMVGVTTGRIETALRLQVLRVLRPAEAAVRRMIFIVAQGVVVKPATNRSAPNFASLRQGERNIRRASFRLSDPMVPMIAHRTAADRLPRISWIAPTDPTIPALLAARRVKPEKPHPDDVRREALVRRLQAIMIALENIPRQAQCIVRWTALRQRIAKLRPTYTSPLRPGPPPGYRKEPVHDVERILAWCHMRAFDTRPKPNTS